MVEEVSARLETFNFFKPLGSTYTSSGKNNVEKHVAAVHEEKEPFKCDSCNPTVLL